MSVDVYLYLYVLALTMSCILLVVVTVVTCVNRRFVYNYENGLNMSIVFI